MPSSPTFILVMVAAAGLYFGGKAVGHGVKKTSHGVCHVVSLGHKCKPEKKAGK
jgi:hypothetical protein